MVPRRVARIYRFRAPVWQTDVDAFGELRSAGLLRFLQETATRASTDAGFDPAFYDRTGTLWLVRRTAVTRLGPIRYGDELEGATWIADFRRVRSRRDYEVSTRERVVARATTDWVFVDRATMKPRRIPREFEAMFDLDGVPPLAREPFPDVAPPPNATRTTRRVELHDLDALQHVNNATYVNYLEQAAEDAHAAAGWALDAQIAAGGRLRAVTHDVEYLDGAVYADEIAIVTWAGEAPDGTIERRSLLARGGRPLVRAVSGYAWADVRTGETRSMPAALCDAMMR